MEGADIYQIAIEKFYAAHIKNMIDAAAVNVMKAQPNGSAPKRKANAKGARKGRNGGNPKVRR